MPNDGQLPRFRQRLKQSSCLTERREAARLGAALREDG
jgi:hypothetical protein